MLTTRFGLKTKNQETLELFLDKGEKFVRYFQKLHIYHGMKKLGADISIACTQPRRIGK